ncbi:MAG: hypothetical protein K2M46_09760 [Lachnospiraceae bacterium]|nr:hypothetical protein [Lachnospiraceae bacterium]
MNRNAKKCRQCGREIYFDGICISCQTENERNRILALSQEEIDMAIRQICDEIEKTGELDQESQLFKNLVNYRDIDTTKIAKAAFKERLFYPCELYKDAPDDVIKEMLEMLKQDHIDGRLAGNLLLCLAVYGGEEVFHAFVELEKNPRKWRENLYVNPSFYATYGGWSYDNSGKFRKTNFEKCYPMVKGTLEEKKHSPVKIGVKTDEKCPDCGCRIVNLMEIDGRDPRLDYLEIPGTIKAKCCPNCIPYSDDNFCRYSIDGESSIISGEEHFSTEDYLEEEGVEELCSNSYILGEAPVPLRYAADWEGGSSIGGFAFWIQDCDIKRCPDCGKPMKYLAQIQWDTVIDNMEGNAYIEICSDCNIIAILHQQT